MKKISKICTGCNIEELLVARTNLTRWQYVNCIMARPTKSNPIRNFYSQPRSLFPRFNMVYYQESWLQLFSAFLALISITLKTSITPVKIKLTLKSTLKLYARLKFHFSVVAFCSPLLFRGRLIAAYLRAKSSKVGVVFIAPERFCASFAVFIESRLSHTIIITWSSV